MSRWVPHIVQSFVHGANVAVAHLQHEAVLLSHTDVRDIPQAGKPFVVTDPNPAISYSDLYRTISTLSVYPFRAVVVPPVLILLMAYFVEFWNLIPYRLPFLNRWFPRITGDARHLQPGLFSICTHLVASDVEARKPVLEGGLGYSGVLTTQQGMVLELLEWNREHDTAASLTTDQQVKTKRLYTTSISLADQLNLDLKCC